MNKIFLIVQREFTTRVRKKSFLVMTLLGPFLFAAMIILPMYFATMEDKDMKLIAVVDSSHVFTDRIPDTKNLKFIYLQNEDISKFSKTFQNEGYWGVLFISNVITYSPNSVILYSHSQPNLGMKYHIEWALKKEIERQVLISHNLEGLDKTLESLKSNVNLRTIKLEDDGKQKESNSDLMMIVGYASGILIYFFIFLFGSQVMRGVIEEKSNRIVEVIVSSVKPFELMMGKIIGIAGVALLQFVLWVVLTFLFITAGQQAFFPELSKSATEKVLAQDVMSSSHPAQVVSVPIEPTKDEGTIKAQQFLESLGKVNFGVILCCFLFYFLGGYLLYAAMFAAVGSAVDNEADTQQFMLPVTIPLILAIYVMINTINNPEGSLSFWFSLIPFTSPIVMMVRIPFGVPYWEVVVSMTLLVATFILFTWLAGKIYRTGILMYGKKVSYKEMWKWMRY
jgi:ABC-2 type transport system permease protein